MWHICMIFLCISNSCTGTFCSELQLKGGEQIVQQLNSFNPFIQQFTTEVQTRQVQTRQVQTLRCSGGGPRSDDSSVPHTEGQSTTVQTKSPIRHHYTCFLWFLENVYRQITQFLHPRLYRWAGFRGRFIQSSGARLKHYKDVLGHVSDSRTGMQTETKPLKRIPVSNLRACGREL